MPFNYKIFYETFVITISAISAILDISDFSDFSYQTFHKRK